MATTAAAMKKIADAADPLYKTLDDGQKRRLAILTHHMQGRSGEGWRHHGDRDDGDRVAAVAWNMAAGTSGSSRNPRPIETSRKSRWIPAAFSPLRCADTAGKTGRFAGHRGSLC